MSPTVGAPTEPFTFATTDDPGALRDEWTALAARSDDVFATYEWLSTWWRHFGAGRRLLLTTVHDADGSLVAILPLYVASTRPVRVLRFLGHGATDQLGPICATADRARARQALASYLADHVPTRWDLAVTDELPVAGSIHGARLLARSPTHVTMLGTAGVSGDAWFAGRSANLRSQLARAERRLAAHGTITMRTADDPEAIGADLDLLVDLHQRRWASMGGSRSFAGREAFHHEVARTFLSLDRLRLRFLEVDGRAVAGLYSFRFEGVESYYQGGRDPAFDHASVGLLLHARAIRACADEGVREYRFLRGDEPYKRRLADATVEQESLAWTRGLLGPLAGAGVARQARLSLPQRRWVPASLAWGTGGSPRWGRP